MKKLLLIVIVIYLLFSCKKRLERTLLSQDGTWIAINKYYTIDKKTNVTTYDGSDTIKIIFTKGGKGTFFRPHTSKEPFNFTYSIGKQDNLFSASTHYIKFSGAAPYSETMYIKKFSRTSQQWETSSAFDISFTGYGSKNYAYLHRQ